MSEEEKEIKLPPREAWETVEEANGGERVEDFAWTTKVDTLEQRKDDAIKAGRDKSAVTVTIPLP